MDCKSYIFFMYTISTRRSKPQTRLKPYQVHIETESMRFEKHKKKHKAYYPYANSNIIIIYKKNEEESNII